VFVRLCVCVCVCVCVCEREREREREREIVCACVCAHVTKHTSPATCSLMQAHASRFARMPTSSGMGRGTGASVLH